MKLSVRIQDGEYWWGGASEEGVHQPFTAKSKYDYDMLRASNQTMPLFLSSLGRYVWCEKPLQIHIADGEMTFTADGEITLSESGSTLRDAYLAASRAHFPFSGKLPPEKFFCTAQYNTWMELDYNQSQESILRYAHALIENGYEPGILMIDEGWHTRYGLWEFDLSKFPDPKAMIDELHSLGFTVMLWVVPLFSADGKDFITSTEPSLSFLDGACGDKKYFLRTDAGDVALVHWWNGYSAILNLCNPDDCELLDRRLRTLMDTYGVDGFKLDGGNLSMYDPRFIVNGSQSRYTPEELNIAWNEFGTRYEYHEYKDTFRGGGKPVIQRIRDRSHTWDGEGLSSLIPMALLQGLIGYPFICPDMVGGGEWSFNYMPDFRCDEELFVRMAECSALFPMMQFSWAPWRLLDGRHASLCLSAARLHKRFAKTILSLARESAVSGEPILRHMEYEYPHAGYAAVNDQFLLGSDVLVAPVIKKGEFQRSVTLPAGSWRYCDGTEFTGGCTVTVSAPLETLPYFERIRKN